MFLDGRYCSSYSDFPQAVVFCKIIEKETIGMLFRGNRWKVGLGFFAVGLLGIIVAGYFCQPQKPIEVQRFPVGVPAAGREGFSLALNDPEQGFRPVFKAQVGSLQVENGPAGIFKTGLHKVATLRALQMELYSYTPLEVPGAGSAPPVSQATGHADEGGVGQGSLRDLLARSQASSSQAWGLWDLSNTSQVCIHDFKARLYQDRGESLQVSSKLALLNADNQDLVLRGRVILSNPAGDRLESNVAKWDWRRNCFVMEQRYLLTRQGRRVTGQGICVDSHLEAVGPAVSSLPSFREIKTCVMGY